MSLAHSPSPLPWSKESKTLEIEREINKIKSDSANFGLCEENVLGVVVLSFNWKLCTTQSHLKTDS